MPFLQTERLRLVPFTHQLITAAQRDPAEVGQLLGVAVAPGWPGPDIAEILPHLAAGQAADPGLAEWTVLIVHRTDNALIGDAGFHGPPDETGTVEIGYSIVPSYRRHGYAFETALALVDWVMARTDVRRVFAEVESAGNVASLRVLEKLGMRRVAAGGEPLTFELVR